MKVPEHLRWASTPSQVVGSNVRRLRKQAGMTLETMSIEAKRHGLKWSAGRAADFEGGRIDLTLDTLLTVAQVVANVTEQPVVLADLLVTEGEIEIAGRTVTDVPSLLRGHPVQPVADQKVTPAELARRHGYTSLTDAADKLGVTKARVPTILQATETAGLVDRRAARALGISLADLIRHSVDLFGRGFSAQRDRVAGDNADTALLGEVTRQLRDQIRQHIDGGPEHDPPDSPA